MLSPITTTPQLTPQSHTPLPTSHPQLTKQGRGTPREKGEVVIQRSRGSKGRLDGREEVGVSIIVARITAAEVRIMMRYAYNSNKIKISLGVCINVSNNFIYFSSLGEYKGRRENNYYRGKGYHSNRQQDDNPNAQRGGYRGGYSHRNQDGNRGGYNYRNQDGHSGGRGGYNQDGGGRGGYNQDGGRRGGYNQDSGGRGGYRQEGHRGGYSNRRQTGYRGGYNYRQHQQTNSDVPTNTTPFKYDSEFDFETANARFKKDSLEKEFKEKLRLDSSSRKTSESYEEGEGEGDEGSLSEEEVVILEDGGDVEEEDFYDKSKSFFDNISCEGSTKDK